MSTPRVGWAITSAGVSYENSRATTTFCMLPPDIEPTSVSTPAPRMSKRSYSLLRVALYRRALLVEAEGVELLVALLPDEEVIGDAGEFIDAGGEPVLRNVGGRRARISPGPRLVTSSPPMRTWPLSARRRPHIASSKLALAVALDGGDAQHLARANRQRHTAHCLQPAVIADTGDPPRR